MAFSSVVTNEKDLNVSLIKLWKNNNFKDYYANLYLSDDSILYANMNVTQYISQLRNAYLALLRAESSLKAIIERVSLYRDFIKENHI